MQGDQFMTTSDIPQSLRAFIDENFLFGVKVTYGDDDSLLEGSIIDSTGVLELIAHLESTYNITIADEDLVPENLDSISRMTKFISGQREKVEVAQ
jgi:acyl carrier protein